MAGQQNQFEINQETLFNKHNKMLMNDVDLWYINDKFSIKTEYNENTTIYNYLMKNLYTTTDCETINIINRTQSVPSTPRCMDNYYYTAPNYEDIQW